MIRKCVVCRSKDIVSEQCLFKVDEKDLDARQYICNNCGAEWYGVPGKGIVIHYSGEGEGLQFEEDPYKEHEWFDESGMYATDRDAYFEALFSDDNEGG